MDEVAEANIAVAHDYLRGRWTGEDSYEFRLNGKTVTINWHAVYDLGASLNCNIDCTGHTAWTEWLERQGL